VSLFCFERDDTYAIHNQWPELLNVDVAGFAAKRFTEFLRTSAFIIISGIRDNINLLQYKSTMMIVWNTAECIGNCGTRMSS
jgi:hypothetical protein